MIKVEKIPNVYANFLVDGDKSVTVRALLLSALCKGETKIINPLLSKDTKNAINCVKKLGARVEIDKKNKTISVFSSGEIVDGGRFYCGNSGTLARLLIGLLAGANVTAYVYGDKSLSARPMARVIDPLLLRGAKIRCKNSRLPVKILPSRLQDFEHDMTVDSAQVKSAILLSGLTSGKKTVINEGNPSRDHTENLLKYLGADIQVNGKKITLKKSSLNAKDIRVFGDPSSSAYYLAMGILKGEVTVKNLLSSPLRTAFIHKLKNSGAKFDFCENVTACGENAFSVTAYKSEISRFEIMPFEVPSLIDEIPLLAVIACFNKGAIMRGVGELRVKESDRLNGIISLVEKIGGSTILKGDTLEIKSAKNINRFDFESDDHRMIMCAHVALLCGEGGVLNGENNVDISFPSYFKNLKNNAFALIGENVENSLSGIIHKHVLNEIGIANFSYKHISLKASEFDEFFKKFPYKAINVTIPYKNAVKKYLKSNSNSVESLNSVNFVLGEKGYSFDGKGFVACLKYNGFEVKNKLVLLYGLGGAGRSIALALLKDGAKVYIKNRTKQTAVDFKNSVNNKNLFLYDEQKCDLLINATSVKNQQLFTDKQLKRARLVIDINYANGLALKKACESLNVKFVNGLQMLFFQAYFADCKIAKVKFDLQSAIKSYNSFKEKYENICC